MKILSTNFGKAIDTRNPLSEYPRPQMVRDNYQMLNGYWDYAICNINKTPTRYDGKIVVPFSPEAKLSGVLRSVSPNDVLYYKKEFNLTFLKDKPRVLLHFDAVDYIAEVTLNGVIVGKHRGGFLPFTFDVTDVIKEENVLEVKVTDPSDTMPQSRGKQKLNRGGIFYTAQSGIWQSVWIEQVAETYVKSVRLTPDIDKRTLTVSLETTGYVERKRITVKLRDKVVLEQEFSQDEYTLQFGEVELWSPENPTLYDYELKADEDEFTGYFAMRKFSTKLAMDGKVRFYLNNLPYFQSGLLDQGYWPDGLLTPPSDEAMIYDIKTMKEMGFNMLRKHIKIEPLRWYYHCDRLGMIVWQDFVNGGGKIHMGRMGLAGMLHLPISDSKYWFFSRTNMAGRTEYLDEVAPTIEHLYNVPSIAVWVPFNEGWGQFDSGMVVSKILSLDKTRLIDHASGWVDQGFGDFRSLHIYWRPVRLPKDARCIALTEFGGYSLPVEGHYAKNKKAFGYKFLKNKEELEVGLKRLYERDIIGNIEKGLSAAIYTQVSDVEDEINGLLTYDRKVEKVGKEKMMEINVAVQDKFHQVLSSREKSKNS